MPTYTLLAAVAALLSLALSIFALLGRPLELALGGVGVSAHDPVRPLVVATGAWVFLLATKRWVLASLLGVLLFAVSLGALASRAPNTWPEGDMAMLELYTVYFAHGHQLLGPYSQFGWSHPGPLPFLVLAPSYFLAQQSTFGLNAGALLFNFGALALLVWLLVRAAASPLLRLTISILTVGYLWRVPDLLTSAWNPHVVVLPFMALLCAAAAAWSGVLGALPIAVFLGSFTSQAHLGLAPVSSFLILIAVAGLLRQCRRPDHRGPALVALAGSVLLAQCLWILPIAEQLVVRPGNVTRIARFFGEGETQTFMVAWRAWGPMLLGLLDPGFTLGWGGAYSGWSDTPSLVVGTFALSLVLAGVWLGGRIFEGFDRSLVAVSALTASVSLLSTISIRVQIGDYHLFWMSALGVVLLAIALTAISRYFAGRRLTPDSWSRGALAATLALLIATAVLGVETLRRGIRDYRPNPYERAVATLATQVMDRLPKTGNRWPLVDPRPGSWPVAPGLLVQLARRGVAYSVDVDDANLLGKHLTPAGHEDVLLTISVREDHENLARRPGNIVLAHDEHLGLYVDAVSLVDHPAYRYAR